MDEPALPLLSPFRGAPPQGRSDPDIVTLHRGWSRLTTGADGEMRGRPLEGFFHANTRLVTRLRLRVDGRAPVRTFSLQGAAHEWSAMLLVPDTLDQGDLPEGARPRGSVEIAIRRTLDGRWEESLRLASHDPAERELRLELELACPVDDVQWAEEMKREEEVGVEGLEPAVAWDGERPELSWTRSFGPRERAPTAELRRLLGARAPVDGEPVERGVDVFFHVGCDARTTWRFEVDPGATTRVALRVALAARGHLELRVRFEPRIEGLHVPPRRSRSASSEPLPRARPATAVRTGNPTLDLMLAQALTDLEELELPVLGGTDSGGDLSVTNAGIPRYVGVFSRDALTTAWQAALLSPGLMEPALARVGALRGVRWDPWRDEEPDRIPHERRLNPLAAVGKTNREVYYGDVVSTPFWIVTLAAAYNWTGERALLARHSDTLDACCRWLERALDEGDGLVYYAPASAENGENGGLNRHHAWKDSGDAIVDGRGRIRVPPLAAVEVQGYAYMALLSAAEIALVRGRPLRARKLARRAAALKRRFDAAFWMPEERFHAVAVDRDGRRIDSVASNVGHCLGTGLVATERIPDVARRLMAPDMFSGWGVRTLSSHNPAYDPFSYHRGSVWPVENATIAAALALCGYEDEALRVVGAQLSLATLFPRMRLPEAISGHARSALHPVPGIYPQANLLQSWSVSALSLFLQVLLGIRAFAPLRTLLVRPVLPEWLPWVELDGLAVGDAEVDLAFWRDARGRSRWEVRAKRGCLLVLDQPPRLSPEATTARRLRDAARSIGYGRIGLGLAALGAAGWLGRRAAREIAR